MIAKFSLDWRVSVHGILHGADRQSKCSILERTNHAASRHPAQVSLDKTQCQKHFMYTDASIAFDTDYNLQVLLYLSMTAKNLIILHSCACAKKTITSMKYVM